MQNMTQENPITHRLIQWAAEREAVRAMLLTSSRTNPSAPVDLFSDYDVVMVVTDIRPFYENRAYLHDFGPVLVVYHDPIGLEYGCERFRDIAQYEDGLKIDFTFYPVAWLRRVAVEPKLPDDLDNGYLVLLDKDHLTGELKPPTYKAYIPTPPSAEAYQTVVEEFFHEATYVAKYLWRDDLMAAKVILDYGIKVQPLRKMLEWRMEIDHHWSVKPGDYGRGLKKRLNHEIWAKLEKTYVGAGLDENWEALFKTIDLFRIVAREVEGRLGYAYPLDLDQRTSAYLQKVQNLDRQAESFL